MNKLFFKSSTGLAKNLTINSESLDRKLEFILAEQRKQRTDLQDIKRMINRITIDKQLQHEVDQYFEEGSQHGIEDTRNDLD